MLYIALLSKKSLNHDESSSPIFINEACRLVNMQEDYDPTSTEGVLQAVEINRKHTLSPNGRSTICNDSKICVVHLLANS